MKNVALVASLALLLAGCQQTGAEKAGSSAPIFSTPPGGTPIATSQARESPESPEGVVYCGGKRIKRVIEHTSPTKTSSQNQWNVTVRIAETDERTKKRTERKVRAMTAFSYFGNQQPPAHFKVALLLEDKGELLIFQDGNKHWLEYGDYRYEQCN